MAEHPTTPLQVSGHRFVLRRLERALLHGDTRVGAPSRPLATGCLAAGVIAAGCVLAGLLRPQPVLGEGPIVTGRASGALYVRVDQTWHPVLNLASARLIAATDADPAPVAESALGRARRGPLLGIPGAPAVLAVPLPADESTWTVCDTATATTVIVGPLPHDIGVAALRPEQPVLVTTGPEAPSYLLSRGRRALVDRADPALAAAVGLDGAVPRPVSAPLVNTIPEAPPTTVSAPAGGPAPPPDGATVLCASWFRGAVTLLAGAGLPVPADRWPVALAQADGAGPAVDAVYLPPSRSAYVRCDGPADGLAYLVTEAGVRFAVHDDAAAGDLGLAGDPVPAPCPVLAALPSGPQLSRAAASVARDVVAAGAGPP